MNQHIYIRKYINLYLAYINEQAPLLISNILYRCSNTSKSYVYSYNVAEGLFIPMISFVTGSHIVLKVALLSTGGVIVFNSNSMS